MNKPQLVSDKAQRMLRTGVAEGAKLLSDTEEFIRRYVILPEPAYLPIALWTIGTHMAQLFDCYPYVALLSAVKRSGKTRLMEVVETLVYEPYRGTAPSPAALYRMLEKGPTLLLDEVEVFNGKNKSETTQTLLAVLNAGHRKGGSIPRCEGPRQEVVKFKVYGPKLFAAIGRLPDTLMDRSIVIHMKRRSKDQKVERFRQARAGKDAKPIHNKAATLARTHKANIERAYQHVLSDDMTYLNDRDADLWSSLFAICTVIDPDQLAELQKNAVKLSNDKAGDDVDDSYSLTLLRDIRQVWPGGWVDGEDRCETSSLLGRLKDLEESPWLEHQLTARKLARLLRPFDVHPRSIRTDGNNTPKGYLREQLKTAMAPYLDEISATCATNQ